MESKEQFIHAFMVSDVIQYLCFKVEIIITVDPERLEIMVGVFHA